MSGPQIPHIELPEIPIPPWSVLAVLLVVAGAYFYSMRKRSWDSMSVLFGALAAAAPVVFWFYIRPTYFVAGDPPTIKPFGTLVALGVYIGSVVAVRHGRDRGLDLDKMNTFIFWVVGLGFVGGHVLDAVFYTPERVQQDPTYLIKIWAGLSSFGGFSGAVLGAVAYKLVKKDNVLAYVDTVCSAFPLAWVFGRSGCASVHDHPGKISDAWYAVKCVNHVPHGEGAAFLCSSTENLGRYDLGLYECLLTIPLATAFWLLWRRKPRHVGFFAGWMCILYAPVRFVLDFFRAGTGDRVLEVDPRHFGLTPAQWACFGLVALGFAVIRIGKASYPPPPATYEEAQRLADAARAEREEGDDDDDDDDSAPKKKASAKTVAAGAKSDKAPSKAAKSSKPSKKGASTKPPKKSSAPSGESKKPSAEPVEDEALAARDSKKEVGNDKAGAGDSSTAKPASDDKTDEAGDDGDGRDAEA